MSVRAWRVITDEGHGASRNMALDHALARSVGDGEAVLRLYRWSRPSVSFGRNEPAAGRYSWPAARERGVDYVRRPTGGRAVLHADELTYAVIAPAGALGGARAAYHRINEALAAALRALGATVEVAADGAALAPDAGPCFRSPAAGEVVAGGRKLVGSAQARIEGALLQHGSIILSGDQSLLEELKLPEPGPPAGDAGDGPDGEVPACLGDLLGERETTALAQRLIRELPAAFAAAFPGAWHAGGYTAAELAEADRLEDEQYAQGSWTWRR